MKDIICVGRQFGTGGHIIAKEFANRMGLKYIDCRLLENECGVEGASEKFQIQKEIILKEAEENDCIFVGRCADYILKNYSEHNVKSIFFVAPMKYRIKKTMEADELTEKQAASKVRKMDSQRSAFYNYHTGCNWGKPSDYNYCINTAVNSKEEILAFMELISKS